MRKLFIIVMLLFIWCIAACNRNVPTITPIDSTETIEPITIYHISKQVENEYKVYNTIEAPDTVSAVY
ncbi:hypothetical protein DFQ01_10679 [Paenibacillus cellulosilyticus]|uniref:YlzJ-like protein n=1 Tax=Paenibacillus cellulosilyticus TaxID=375489 RepID=A0A2V2YUT0_9BACL|nr:hypothetical protein DFQ01_10679 [Paenibacillus cellulosilyticus]